MPSPPPLVRVRGALSEVLASSLLGILDETTLRGWLMQRRWFAAKAREPSSVHIAAVIPLEWGGEGDAIAVVAVDVGDGRLQHYQLPLSVRARESIPADVPVLVEVETEREHGVVVDATMDPAFRRRLAEAFRTGVRFGDTGARWTVEPVEPAGVALDPGDSRVIRGEQSNTSIVFGSQAILKLFRRLEPGIHPDVEIGHFLTTRARYAHTPQLLGTIAVNWGGGAAAVAGMLQRFLPGSRDAWEYALERIAAYLGGGAPDFADEAADLGRITRELHEALASASDVSAFTPEAARRDDVALWADATRRSAEQVLALLESKLDALPAAITERAHRVLARRDAVLDRIGDAADTASADAGVRIRHHGDYHLGQVLRTAEGQFAIIDFEGEPSRPLAERRARHSPLRDVAGMLRSFAYAGAMGAAESSAADANERAITWERTARDAFLSSYLHHAESTALLLPRSDAAGRALISLFELEKVCYELGYELNNRPDWVWIPLRGIERELAMDDGETG